MNFFIFLEFEIIIKKMQNTVVSLLRLPSVYNNFLSFSYIIKLLFFVTIIFLGRYLEIYIHFINLKGKNELMVQLEEMLYMY